MRMVLYDQLDRSYCETKQGSRCKAMEKMGSEISAELVILKRSLQRWLFISSIDERPSLPGV